jgi:hypothetical protein
VPIAIGKAVVGAAEAIVGPFVEVAHELVDEIQVGLYYVSGGRFEVTLTSDLMKAFEHGATRTEVLKGMAEGLIGTPGRLLKAAEDGDWEAVGKEAVNLYLLVETVKASPKYLRQVPALLATTQKALRLVRLRTLGFRLKGPRLTVPKAPPVPREPVYLGHDPAAGPRPPAPRCGPQTTPSGPVGEPKFLGKPPEPADAGHGSTEPELHGATNLTKDETNLLNDIVRETRHEVEGALKEAGDQFVPGEAHLSPECMGGACGFSRRSAAQLLTKAGVSKTKIFMNQVRDIAGRGAHTFAVAEIAPGKHVLIDTSFAQFTGDLTSSSRWGESILRKSGRVGEQLRNELLSRGYIVLTDELADVYVKAVGEVAEGRFTVSSLIRDRASLARNPHLLTIIP